jgi:RNA polymerase sigma-70 factor, ECF subfamily
LDEFSHRPSDWDREMTLLPPTRHSLLVRLHDASDDVAWGEFLSLYEPAIYRLARRRGLQDADAREVTQEVLLTIAKVAQQFSSEEGHASGRFRGWLAVTTRNRVIDRFRRRSKTAGGGTTNIQRLADHPDRDATAEDLAIELRRQCFALAAESVRSEVSHATWQAFWQTAVEGQSASAVAERLKMSVGNVYVARCRVLDRMRRWVTERSIES